MKLTIIQARSTSKRFPNKVLKNAQIIVLEILIKRLKHSKD